MGLSVERKLERTEHCLEQLQALFDVRSLGEHAALAAQRKGLPVREADFRS